MANALFSKILNKNRYNITFLYVHKNNNNKNSINACMQFLICYFQLKKIQPKSLLINLQFWLGEVSVIQEQDDDLTLKTNIYSKLKSRACSTHVCHRNLTKQIIGDQTKCTDFLFKK